MKNNKGFTLIELIVVIAIIAVLAVVLAPQYIQYVERGRESNDIQTAQNLMDAASVAAADPSLKTPAPTYSVVLDASGTLTLKAGATEIVAGDDFFDAFAAIVGNETKEVQSVKGKAGILTITVDTKTGSVSYTDSDAADDNGWSALLD